MRPKLILTFQTGYSESFSMCVDLDEYTARQFTKIEPPIPGIDQFSTCVYTLQAREFRKDSFRLAAQNLGSLLAERMEDAEGWHDISRIEPAKSQLREPR